MMGQLEAMEATIKRYGTMHRTKVGEMAFDGAMPRVDVVVYGTTLVTTTVVGEVIDVVVGGGRGPVKAFVGTVTLTGQ